MDDRGGARGRRGRAAALAGLLLGLVAVAVVAMARSNRSGSPPDTFEPVRGYSPVVIGDTVVAIGEGERLLEHPVRSRDGGRTWGRIALREPQPDVTWSLRRLGDLAVAVAVARTDAGEPSSLYVWTTADGERWTGGFVDHTSELYVGARRVGGTLFIDAITSEGSLLTSRDDGASWTSRPVAGLSLPDDTSAGLIEAWRAEDGSGFGLVDFAGTIHPDYEFEHALVASDDGSSWRVVGKCASTPNPPRGPCNPVFRAGTLLARGLEVSLDGGASWAEAVFDGQFENVHRFESVVELDGGGWLATLYGYVYAGGGPLAWLVRSDDGVRWTPLLGPGLRGCPVSPADTSTPANWASEPLPVDDGWLVTFSCPAGAALFEVDGRGRTFRERMRPGRGEDFGKPVVWRDEVLVTVVEEDGSVFRLRPVPG